MEIESKDFLPFPSIGLSHEMDESDNTMSPMESEMERKETEVNLTFLETFKTNPELNGIPFFEKKELFLLEKIEKEGFTEVYMGKTKNELLALKKFDLKQHEHALHEDAILTTVEAIRSNDRYPMAYRSFLKYHGLFRGKFFGELEEGLIMIMEAGLLTLETVFTQERKLSEAHLFFFLSEMTNLLVILQENGIAHCDIKPTNIVLFLNEKKEISFKLIDFGVSIKLENDMEGMVGRKMIKGHTIYYASPEILSLVDTSSTSKINIFKSDAFSLGLLILQLTGLKYRRKDLNKILDSFPSRLEKKGYKNLVPILTHLLNPNPDDRLDFLQLWKMLDSYNFQQEIPPDWDFLRPVLVQTLDKYKLSS